MFLGVDTGGTFTDFVCHDASGMRFHKVLSTPDDPSRAILQGIQALGLDPHSLHLVHGSTVATNAVLERKGVRTLFVGNAGLEDLIRLGRQTRDALYELCPQMPEPWLHAADITGLQGRISANGEEIAPLDANELAQLNHKAKAYDAVAICQLFSFLNGEHEQLIKAALPVSLFVSVSHEVVAEYREYERAATTFLNAYVGPLVQSYLSRLEQSLAAKHLFIMHSAGGVMSAEEAGHSAVRLVLSGPAGGLVAAREIAQQLDRHRLLTFDMGGTSTDVALLDGPAVISTEGSIAGIPVSVPMLDIHTIGAGGGSMAWLDTAGLPQVGPASAGAAPGPACYGNGGTEPTVTDANVVLGRVPASAKLAGSMALDADAARTSLSHMAKALNIGIEEAAEAVLQIAEEHMAAALRVVSVQKGHDPQDFSLLCFGGAGGLHACALAEKLGMNRVVVPVGSGAFSALGMLAGKQQRELSRSRRMLLGDSTTAEQLTILIKQLKDEATAKMQGLSLAFDVRVDACYEGQGFHLSLPYNGDVAYFRQLFEAEHETAYGYKLHRAVELMTVRLTAVADKEAMTWPMLAYSDADAEACGHSDVYNVGEVNHYSRADLKPGQSIAGPALVLEEISTLWLPPLWRLEVSAYGHLLLERTCTPLN